MIFHMHKWFATFIALLAISFFAFNSVADTMSPLLVAQYQDVDDSYDPFADYSEFEEATQEEADINFFKNGRFLSVGGMLGYRFFTNILSEIYEGTSGGGLFLSYFFDLRFAFQVSYYTGNHSFGISENGVDASGSVTLSETGFNVKYFLNTQNVTRGLAPINPYLIFGLSQIYRTGRFDGIEGESRDSALGFNGGFGIEFPLMNNKMFFGFEGMYQFVSFEDENNELFLDGQATGIYPRGDTVRAIATLGVNF